MKASDVIQSGLDRLDSHDKWYVGRGEIPDGGGCLVTSMSGVTQGEEFLKTPMYVRAAFARALDFVMDELGVHDVTAAYKFNDDPSTSFEDVRLTLKLAKERALEAGE